MQAISSKERNFRIFARCAFFEKGNAGDKRMRIAGVISTEELDKQGEVMIQKGLDFSYFLKEGWFNDNHSKKTADVLGHPVSVQLFEKGNTLPDGSIAKANCTWVEGYLLNNEDGRRVWELGQTLAKSDTGRCLGFSIEGKALRRAGPGQRIVAEAFVRNVAITNCPVGEGTRLLTLQKSMEAVLRNADDQGNDDSEGGDDIVDKALETSTASGSALATESLENDDKPLSEVAGTALMKSRGFDDHQAGRLWKALTTKKEQTMTKPTAPTKAEIDAAIDGIEAGAKVASRKTALLQKSMDGTATADESKELSTLLLGGDSLGTNAAAAVAGEIQKSMDISPWLGNTTKGIADGLKAIGDGVEKGNTDDASFRSDLAKSLRGLSQVVFGIREDLTTLLDGAAHPPRSVGTNGGTGVSIVEKSMAGGTPQAPGDTLTKSMAAKHLTDMAISGFQSEYGIDFAQQATKVESAGLEYLDQRARADIKRYLANLK